MSAAHKYCESIHTLQYQFAAHLRDPQRNLAPAGIEDQRLKIYRDLFFNNIENLLSANFPVIRTLYNDEAWRTLVRDFYRDHQCHTPLFTEIAREFLRYLEARQQCLASDPPFLLELAHYEWAELALSLDETDLTAIPHRPDGNPLHGIPVISPLAWRLGYRFPVHRIRPDYQPEQPPEQATWLLLIRDREDQVSFLEIDPLAALLIERLHENTTASGLECLKKLLSELGDDSAHNLSTAGAQLLIDLQARSAILGTRN